MRLLLLSFLFLSFNFNKPIALQQPIVKATALPKKKLIVKNDSAKVELRRFDQQAVNKYSVQKEFIYDDVVPATQTLWQKFWSWFWRSVNKILGNKMGGNIVKYILTGLVIAIVVFVIFKLIGIDFKFLSGRSKIIEVPYQESLENIHEINFDEQIEKATQEENYRLVVRLLYLKTLKRLNDQNVINWKPDKTNQTYILEIIDEKDQNDFANLTKQFEYVWYGEFYIDKRNFEPIQQSFTHFNQPTK